MKALAPLDAAGRRLLVEDMAYQMGLDGPRGFAVRLLDGAPPPERHPAAGVGLLESRPPAPSADAFARRLLS